MMPTVRQAPRTAALLFSLALSSSALAQPGSPAPAPPAQALPSRSAAESVATAGAAAEARTSALDARIAALFTPNGGLTSAEVAAKAASTSFDVRVRHAELEAAAAAVDQALIGYFPRLSLLAGYTRLSPVDIPTLGNIVVAPSVTVTGDKPVPVPAGTQLVSVPLKFEFPLNQTTMQASLSIPLSDYVFRLSHGYAVASHSEKAAEINERAAKLKAGLDGTIAYYNWARAKLQAFVAQQALEQAKVHLADARNVYEAGSGSKADVLRAEAQIASSELLVQRASSLVTLTAETIRTAMHETTPREFAIGEDLRAALASPQASPPLDALVAEALNKRLEVRALDETAWSLKEQAKVVRAGYLPRLNALGEVTYANPNPRIFPPADKFDATWSAGVQLSWTLNDIAVAAAAGKQADARAAQVTAQKSALMDALRIEVTQAELARADAEAAVVMTARALAAAEESYRVRRELYKNGRATSIELTDAETELTRAELEAVNARVDLRLARARLEHAVGRDVAPSAP